MIRKTTPKSWAFLAATIASFAVSGAGADTFHGLNAGAPIWNGNLLLTEQQAAAFAATGTKSLRVNFRIDHGHSTWDQYQFDMYDQVIANARGAGLEVLGLFSNETVAGGQAAWNNDADGDGFNDYVHAFADTAQLLADRYRNDVVQWEVWNEPNAWSNPNYASDPQNAGGTYILPRVYATLLSETYRHLNAQGYELIDNGVSLASGGLLAHDIGGSFSTAMDYMQQVYNQSAVWNAFEADFARRYAWDDFGYHFYIRQGGPVTEQYLASYFNAVRAGQASNNDPANVVVTEFSWQTVGSNTQTLQRDNMATAYDFLESRPYVSGTYWYQWTDDVTGAWGIVDLNGQPKLSYHEFVARNQQPYGDNIVVTVQRAASDAGLGTGYSASDILHGLIATQRAGDQGWHPANPAASNSFDPNGLPAFTDGQGDIGSGLTGLLNDFPPPGQPAKLLEYALGDAYDIDMIRMFTGNFGKDGRIFSSMAVYTSRDGANFDLLGYFQSDPSGATNNASTPGGPQGATLVEIAASDGASLATDVTHLRFDLYAVANIDGVAWDPFNGLNPFTGEDDGFAAAYVSPLVREIDVFGTLSPLVGDLNGDRLVDIFDVAIVSGNWGAMGEPGAVAGDANHDGEVDIFDVAVISTNWRPAAAASVPEPSTHALAACLALALVVVRARGSVRLKAR